MVPTDFVLAFQTLRARRQHSRPEGPDPALTTYRRSPAKYVALALKPGARACPRSTAPASCATSTRCAKSANTKPACTAQPSPPGCRSSALARRPPDRSQAGYVYRRHRQRLWAGSDAGAQAADGQPPGDPEPRGMARRRHGRDFRTGSRPHARTRHRCRKLGRRGRPFRSFPRQPVVLRPAYRARDRCVLEPGDRGFIAGCAPPGRVLGPPAAENGYRPLPRLSRGPYRARR